MSASDKGFTLIESLLALLIMLFSITAIFPIFINSTFLNVANSNLTVAISHAQYALEEKKEMNFISIPIGTETWDSGKIISKGLIPLNSETVAITVTNSGSYMKDIIATVSWRGRGIINRNIALETLITGQ